jgi:uncharacterized OB-fold protein
MTGSTVGASSGSASTGDKPRPVPTATSEPFWTGLRDHKVMLQYSPSTDAWVFYPRVLAPGSLADDLEWREASGAGFVYSYTVTRRPTGPPWADDVPQVIAVVELAEGPRLTTELVHVNPAEVRVGLPVRPVFMADQSVDDVLVLLRFEPAGHPPATGERRA